MSSIKLLQSITSFPAIDNTMHLDIIVINSFGSDPISNTADHSLDSLSNSVKMSTS